MNKKAFSLFEILVVVIIISVIYVIGIASISSSKSKEKIDIFKMKKFLVKNYGYDVELICVDECKKCYVDNQKKIVEIEQNFDFKTDLSVYFIDKNYHEYRESFSDFDDKEVCLRYKISKKGVSEPMIIESGELFFTLSSFVGEVKSFVSMGEARDWYRKSEYDLGDIY